MESLERFRRVVEEEAQPLLERLREIDVLLEELGVEKREIQTVLRRVDLLPKAEKPKAKPVANGRPDVAQHKLDALERWLIENREEINAGDGIYASQLSEDPEWTIIGNPSGINKALQWEHERGVLTLESIGSGGRKVYKVAS